MAAPKKLISRVRPETPGDEIAISGISGRFPNSHDMEEYEYNLYNKVSFFYCGLNGSEDRYNPLHF